MKHSLLELNQFLKRVVIANLPDKIWVTCEIMQIGQSRGNFYIDLIEKDSVTKQVVAQSQAVLWSSTYYRLKKKLGTNFKNVLQSGIEVLIEVRVDFSERYGLKLVIENIDPAYTLGQMQMQRQQTIKQLKKENLLDKNGLISLNKIPQNIAIISSEKAAGFQDFMEELLNNQYNYQFKYQLFKAGMQGQFVEKEVSAALNNIELQQSKFDAIVIIRGGGSKLDLSGFDSLKICRLISNSSLPVLTGIGHDVDECVADLVAHTSLKTPTAVATFLIEQFLNFEIGISNIELNLNQKVNQVIQEKKQEIESLENEMKYLSKSKLENANRMLTYIEQELPKTIKSTIRNQKNELKLIAKTIQLLSPEQVLKRGFTMTTKNGQIIKSKDDLAKGDIIETHFSDGKRTAEIIHPKK